MEILSMTTKVNHSNSNKKPLFKNYKNINEELFRSGRGVYPTTIPLQHCIKRGEMYMYMYVTLSVNEGPFIS